PYGAFRQVSGRPELITALHEPNAANQLPERIRQWPLFADLSGTSMHWRWHDWKRNIWRVIGADSSDSYPQLRSNALFLRARGSDGSVIESWPLPPRDPRPPAVAIAALCMAATWWLCAWRYRRRIRLASVAAA